MAIHINTIHPPMIAARPVSPAPVKTSSPSLHTAAFSTLFGSLTANKPVQRTTGAGTAAAASPTSTAAATNPPAATVKIPVSSDGTSLANLMAAASYAGVPYDDLAQKFGAQSVSNPNYQRDLADAIEARLQLVAGPGISTQVYDPNPANDRVAPDLTNTKQFSSSGDQIQGLLNSMWSAVHSGDVNGYHTALQNVDSWYQSNGQQNYQTGLTDGQVAAFNPANRALMTSMPNANASIAAAELAAITGQSASMSNLAEVAQSAAIKT